jgi:antitoxin component of RelBE/YafQ-DinJ toxin-antitoxin module
MSIKSNKKMTEAVRVRLDEDTHEALVDRASRVGVKPSTLARMAMIEFLTRNDTGRFHG